MTSDKLVIAAGCVALLGSFNQSKRFPENGYAIIFATSALAFIFSLGNRTAIEKPLRAIAALMLLTSLFTYIPKLTQTQKRKKKNG